ncbi:unnamed protein product, partial [Phaeothamnion confervicola]
TGNIDGDGSSSGDGKASGGAPAGGLALRRAYVALKTRARLHAEAAAASQQAERFARPSTNERAWAPAAMAAATAAAVAVDRREAWVAAKYDEARLAGQRREERRIIELILERDAAGAPAGAPGELFRRSGATAGNGGNGNGNNGATSSDPDASGAARDEAEEVAAGCHLVAVDGEGRLRAEEELHCRQMAQYDVDIVAARSELWD